MPYEPQFDDMLFSILHHVGGIDKFIDTVFCFLYRRTDLFRVKQNSSERLGLPPGMAQKMVKMLCKRYVDLELKTRNANKPEAKPSPAQAHDAVVEVSKEAAETSEKPSPKKEHKEIKNDDTSAKVDSVSDSDLSRQDHSDPKAEESTCENKSEPVAVAAAAEEAEDPERRYYDSNPECYNGASYDNYCWSQNIYDLDVQVKVPHGIRNSGQVKVLIERNHLRVEALQDEKWQVLIDGVLSYEIKLEGSTWTLHPNDHVYVQLVKSYERYWEALLEGEPKINVRKIDCSKPYEDLDEEARAKLQEMMFDQHQKLLGKPTSKQLKVHEMLKKAWDKKDSPFKGQEFDPNLFNVSE